MGDRIQTSGFRGMDGKEYTLGVGDGPEMRPLDKKLRFFYAISEGNEGEVNTFLEDGLDPNGSVPVPVASLRYNAAKRLTLDTECTPGYAKFWEWISTKLHERIAAERTKDGKKPYIPLTCQTSWGRTYQLTPLMVAYLYGNQNIVDLLISKGANPNSTTVIQYYAGEKAKVYSPESWKPQDFAFPSRSAKGGTRRKRRAKKVPRRNRGTRRTPQKK